MCFVQDQVTFLQEMARVTRRCFAVGLLHRRSLLWCREGRGGGQGGYQGAHWHTKHEVVGLCATAGLSPVLMGTALHFPSGNRLAKMFEKILPLWWPWGGFLIVPCKAAVKEKDTSGSRIAKLIRKAFCKLQDVMGARPCAGAAGATVSRVEVPGDVTPRSRPLHPGTTAGFHVCPISYLSGTRFASSPCLLSRSNPEVRR